MKWVGLGGGGDPPSTHTSTPRFKTCHKHGSEKRGNRDVTMVTVVLLLHPARPIAARSRSQSSHEVAGSRKRGSGLVKGQPNRGAVGNLKGRLLTDGVSLSSVRTAGARCKADTETENIIYCYHVKSRFYTFLHD